MEEEVMANIEIRDFMNVSSVEPGDNIVLSLGDGSSAKMLFGVFRSIATTGITPSIKEGYWWIGETETEVVAEGQTPILRKTGLGIEWKYRNGPTSEWELLVPMNDILFKFDDLTDSQRELITLKFEDLTPEEIAALQKPAADMIAQLTETDTAVKAAETKRVEAETARAEAETERETAETARVEAETNREKAETLREESEDDRESAENARESAEDERQSSESKRASSESVREQNEEGRILDEEARTAAENKRAAAELSRVNAEDSRVREFATLKADSMAATKSAQDTANHPTYIGEDNYVYQWNKEAQAYDKTAVYVRGEGFSIKKVYASVDAMMSDKSSAFKEGDFCLINTENVENPDNAKLYVRSAAGAWDFLVDMSGAVGFTGKTPQFQIGTVSVGAGKASASVSLSPDGTDAEGNPKFKINYLIPCLSYEDLTADQIADLQRPASEMISKLQATDNSVKAAESLRVSAEEARQGNENERISTESLRTSAETLRNENESARKSEENIRKENEEARKQSESVREQSFALLKQNAEEATDRANDAADNARNQPIIQNGTWWVFDMDAKQYVDTGYAVSSDYQLTKEKVEGVLQGNIQSHWHDQYALTEDLSSLATTEALNKGLEGKVDKDGSKQLSTEDFTTLLKQKLESLENYDDTEISNAIEGLRSTIDNLVSGNATKAIESFNEIRAFLAGVEDSETLEGIIAGIERQIAYKQDKIEDLETIRAGAKLGGTALQEIPDNYLTTENIGGLGFVTSEVLETEMEKKQNVNLYFNAVSASVWVEDSTYPDFGLRCDIALEGVTEDDYPEVIYNVSEAMSGMYSPVSYCGNGYVSIWSSSDRSIVIPTIVINR